MRVHIYGLKDPRDGKIRYVGKTSTPLRVRLQSHIDVARRHPDNPRPVLAWIRELLTWGVLPVMVSLEDVAPERWRQAERDWGKRLDAKTRLSNSMACLGNGPVTSYTARWTPEFEARLGVDTDEQIASDMGITRKAVSYRRNVLGIAAPAEHWQRGKPPPMGGHNRIDLPNEVIVQLGTMSDQALARLSGVSKPVIGRVRRTLGIPSYAMQTGNTGQWATGNFPQRWLDAGDSRVKRKTGGSN